MNDVFLLTGWACGDGSYDLLYSKKPIFYKLSVLLFLSIVKNILMSIYINILMTIYILNLLDCSDTFLALSLIVL